VHSLLFQPTSRSQLATHRATAVFKQLAPVFSTTRAQLATQPASTVYPGLNASFQYRSRAVSYPPGTQIPGHLTGARWPAGADGGSAYRLGRGSQAHRPPALGLRGAPKPTFLSLKLPFLSLKLTFLSLKLTFLSLKLTVLSLKLTFLSLKLRCLSLKLRCLS
jgi:hypothetical protein